MAARSMAPAHRRTLTARRWLGVAVAALALVATLYLGAMSVLWFLHVKELRAETEYLASLSADRTAQIADQERGALTASTRRSATISAR